MRVIAVTSWALLCVAAAAPTKEAPAADEFDVFGVVVRAPEGWQRQWEGRPNMIARWTNATPTSRATAAMTLELERANGRTLPQFAEALRKQYPAAHLNIHALVMGNQPAMRITSKDASGNSAVDVFFALAGEHFYILSGFAAVPRLLPSDAMDEMARTMRFRAPVDPALATALREPVTFFERFSIAPLATMRPAGDEPETPRTLRLVTTDHRTGRAALSMEIHVLPNPKRVPLIEYAAQVTQRLARGAAVEWRTWGTPPERGLSQPFDFAPPDGAAVRTRLGLVRLSDDELLYLNFAIGSDGADARGAMMEQACQRVVESVTPYVPPR